MALKLAALLLPLGLGAALASTSSSSQPEAVLPLTEPQQQARSSTSASSNSNFQDQCNGFDPAAAGIANATVTSRTFVASNTTVDLKGNDAACGQAGQLVPVDLCRVALQIATTNRSGVVAEVWLPVDWNGRLVTTGNGGLGGCEFLGSAVLFSVLTLWGRVVWCGVTVCVCVCGRGGLVALGKWLTDRLTLGVDYASMAYTAQNGFASVGTNNGHNGTSGIQFLNNEDVVIDFSYRA